MSAPFSRLLAAGLAVSALSAVTAASAAPTATNTCAALGSTQPATTEGAACRLADELESSFVYPEQGRRYAAALRANVASGRYAALSGEEAARLMTADLQAIAPDGHLRVSKPSQQPTAAPASAPPTAGAPTMPPLLEQGGWIAPGIAFLRINAFMYDDEQTAAVAKFMADYADAEAIIFDLRTHRGGGMVQMNVILPWLFAEETRLVTLAMRRSVEDARGAPFDDGPTLRKLAGTPQETVREHWALPNSDARLRDAKVYLLTSRRTGSAAEHFALAMKHTGRATLVGSNTAGANHFGGGVPLPGGFEAWIPVGRTYDPVTGKDWEGDGVAPDVAVPPEEALAWVLKDLGVDAAKAQELAASHAPTLPMVRRKA